MTTWNIGGGLTCVSLGLTTVEPSVFSAMAALAGGAQPEDDLRIPFLGWNNLMANMDNRSRFFKPFKRLGAAFTAKVQLSGELLQPGHTLLTVAGNSA